MLVGEAFIYLFISNYIYTLFWAKGREGGGGGKGGGGGFLGGGGEGVGERNKTGGLDRERRRIFAICHYYYFYRCVAL